MTTLLMTGFPGFLGSALLGRLLARRPGAPAVCLVQAPPAAAGRRLAEIEAADAARGRPGRLVVGDLTAARLGLDAPPTTDARGRHRGVAPRGGLRPRGRARSSRTGSTSRAPTGCSSSAAAPRLPRLQHVSTCYVSGRYDGEFREDDLDVGQDFRNHYESTKYAAEMLVRKAMADGLPATVYRPASWSATRAPGRPRSTTGRTSWPRSCAGSSRRGRPGRGRPGPGARLCGAARLRDRGHGPAVGAGGVGGQDLRADRPAPPDGARARRDPRPATGQARGVGAATAGARPGRRSRCRWPKRLTGLPVEALDYFASPTTYDTTHTVRDLAARA